MRKVIDKFLETLRDSETPIGLVYFSIFSRLMSEEDLGRELLYWGKLVRGEDPNFPESVKDGYWFAIVHKSFRTVDVFQGIFRETKVDLISPEEEAKYRAYKYKLAKGEVSKRKQGDSGIGSGFTDEYEEILDIHNRRKRQVGKEDVSGALDSMLYNLIDSDELGVLSKAIKTASDFGRVND